jgi:putative zinc finger protein
MCESKDLLVAFLYGELDAGDRRTFQTHLTSCAECREELAGLRATRGQIASWTPPEPDFGFRIVRGAAAPPAPRFRIAPAWGLAAAAVLVMAMAAAIANVEVRYGGDGLVVRTGWNRGGEAASATVQRAGAPDATPIGWSVQTAALDRRLRELEAAVARTPPAVHAAGPRLSDAEVLRRVRDMVDQSETRQQRELVLRVRQVLQDVEARRRTDLAAIQQGFGQLQGATAMEAAQHRDVMNYLRLVSQQKQQ